MVMEKVDKELIRKLREQMVDAGIEIVATGWFDYKGKKRELILKLNSEESETD